MRGPNVTFGKTKMFQNYRSGVWVHLQVFLSLYKRDNFYDLCLVPRTKYSPSKTGPILDKKNIFLEGYILSISRP